MIVSLVCAMAAAASQAEGSAAVCRQLEAGQHALDYSHRETFGYAAKLFVAGRFAAAYGRLTRLADRGHLPSAQLALVMYQLGKPVFGSEWDASEEQLEHWGLLVGCTALRAARG